MVHLYHKIQLFHPREFFGMQTLVDTYKSFDHYILPECKVLTSIFHSVAEVCTLIGIWQGDYVPIIGHNKFVVVI